MVEKTGVMEDKYNLQRFLDAQKSDYDRALQELSHGRKRSHWIWYIFPQLAVLGYSHNAKYYGIGGRGEAEAYLQNPILGMRLREAAEALLAHPDKKAVDILGNIDAVKVRSCMTLFDAVSPGDVFRKVLDVFYNGSVDKMTLENM